MDAGRAAEFDSPEALLADPNSLFAQLVAQSAAQHGGSAPEAAAVAHGPINKVAVV
jgi:hypothetical protein